MKLFKPLNTRSLKRFLPIYYALLCLIPFLLFFSCIIRFNLIDEPFAVASMAAFLVITLAGYILLRNLVSRIIDLSSVASPEKIDAPSSNENELTQIATTFADLLVRLEGTAETLDKRIRELRSIGDITRLTAKSTNMKQLFDDVLEEAMMTMGASHGIIMSVSRDGSAMKPEVLRGIAELYPDNQSIPVNGTILGRPVLERRPIITAHPSRDKHFNDQYDSQFSEGPLLALPMTARGSIIGVLVLSRGKYAPIFDEMEIEYVSTALSQAAFAFNNAHLVNELKTTCKELRSTRTKLVTSERIAAINQTAVTLSDKLNSPLTVIKGHIEIIRRMMSNDESGVRRSLDIIDASITRCVDIMTRLARIQDHAVTDYPGGDSTMIDISAYNRVDCGSQYRISKTIS